MTTELAILNKNGIALAADSAVTVTHSPQRQKVYNTANKLFMLSKYHPVGIMVFGNASFMGMPWETVIKDFRQKLDETSYPTIADYARAFIENFEQGASLITAADQAEYFEQEVTGFFTYIRDKVNKAVEEEFEAKKKPVPDTRVRTLAGRTIKEEFDSWTAEKNLPTFSDADVQELLKAYKGITGKVVKQVFQKLPLTKTARGQLEKLSVDIFCKDRFFKDVSGIVVAGFGDQEHFPALKSFFFAALVNGKLKHKERSEAKISAQSSAEIHPFAQDDMIVEFVEGMHPELTKFLDGYVKELFRQLSDGLLQSFAPLMQDKKDAYAKTLKSLTKQLLTEFEKQMKTFKELKHVAPILGAVASLPKDELATMAEALVNLTSFKRKMSMDVESVGGPIDVAVISKGDGFVWIKRKHYFKPEFNPHFQANYYRKTPDEGRGHDTGSED